MGCSAKGPQLKVLGVQEAPATQSQSLVLFVEVVNPSARELRLSRLDYKFEASKWFASKGQVQLARDVAAGGSAMVELRVPVTALEESPGLGTSFVLDGTLYAKDDRLERSWQVKAKGDLAPGATAGLGVPRIRVATVR